MTTQPTPTGPEPVAPVRTEDRKTVVAREKDAFGGVKIGSAFFGWLVATGMTVVLTALLAAVAGGLNLVSSPEALSDAARANNVSTDEIGWGAAVVVLVVVFLAYLAGGYVAGRMARFNGLKQGAAVFGWSVLIAVVVALLGAVAGAQFNVLSEINSFPNIPSSLEGLSLQGIVVLVGVVVVALVGAMLGGLTGMRYHRRIDKAGLGR
ncbi:hypothetical protein ENKNEFLB_03655 [Nocardioides aquaticus]|uniref:Major facilitator superfamily (MFS) profile domain-containing protein n=1 Tax=Nocardioides aquaticus TaxID=160826 RepID=A0ABX8EMC7_9ACTN|nr:hypothetical protein [Nocardioides aquaticus]QVT81247.1 hypothetical protein ENKNEFLB_03655 [Nocardioides aquaticus]